MPGTRTILATWFGTAALLATVGMAAGAQTFFVSTDGDDRWTGTIPAPNPAQTDGPFASLARARDAVRQWKSPASRSPNRCKCRSAAGRIICRNR